MYSFLKQVLLGLPLVASSSVCKPRPGDSGWPQPREWQALNSTVSGRLVRTVPPAAVCHPDRPEHNDLACAVVRSQWTNTSFHYLNPVSVDYNDDTCPPSFNQSCSNAGYPAYSIIAETARDVQAGVLFARQHGVRLVIKGTGHDYPGRSSGADSLLINTPNIKGLAHYPNDSRAVRLGGTAAVKIHAGSRMIDVYTFASAHNISIVGGADMHVGAGGWFTGGGHSPISGTYGLGADQVLEMEVVTADGHLRTLKPGCRDADLFWALRGGGGSTFAVVISVTVKAYPSASGTQRVFGYSTAANSDAFWSMLAHFHTQIPTLAEAGVHSYYYTIPSQGQLLGTYISLNTTNERLAATTGPLEQDLRDANYTAPIKTFSHGVDFPDFMRHWYTTNQPEAAGSNGRLGSRLLDAESLADFDKLKEALPKAMTGSTLLIGHIVAAPGTRNAVAHLAGGDNAVLPAWRNAYAHVVVLKNLDGSNQTANAIANDELRNHNIEALRQLAPNTGAYRNEADPTEPNWQRAFHGDHYPRLLKIKQRYDPHGVFWCKSCVGSELWNTTVLEGDRDGVGQSRIRLCRAI